MTRDGAADERRGGRRREPRQQEELLCRRRRRSGWWWLNEEATLRPAAPERWCVVRKDAQLGKRSSTKESCARARKAEAEEMNYYLLVRQRKAAGAQKQQKQVLAAGCDSSQRCLLRDVDGLPLIAHDVCGCDSASSLRQVRKTATSTSSLRRPVAIQPCSKCLLWPQSGPPPGSRVTRICETSCCCRRAEPSCERARKRLRNVDTRPKDAEFRLGAPSRPALICLNRGCTSPCPLRAQRAPKFLCPTQRCDASGRLGGDLHRLVVLLRQSVLNRVGVQS